MAQTVAEVMTAALALPEPERAELAELLDASLENQPKLHPAWSDELRRRAEEVASGECQPVPWDEVRRQVQAQLDGDPTRG